MVKFSSEKLNWIFKTSNGNSEVQVANKWFNLIFITELPKCQVQATTKGQGNIFSVEAK